MRELLVPAVVIALFAPLGACYVGNTPPSSRRTAPAAADAAPAPEPEAPAADDAGAPPEDPPPACATDAECGDDARCVVEGGRARCELVPPAERDAGAPDAGAVPDCRALCDGAQCGFRFSEACGEVTCGTCGAGLVCNEGFNRCDPAPYTGPLWALRVASARVDRCDTSWDQCANGGQPFCSPTPPDPFVRVAGAVTAPAGNRCAGQYDQEVGVLDEPRLLAGLDFVLEDDDSPISNVRGGDVVCRGRLAPSARDLAAGTLTVACAGGSVTFTFARRR